MPRCVRVYDVVARFVTHQAVLGSEREDGGTDRPRPLATRRTRRPRPRRNARESCSTLRAGRRHHCRGSPAVGSDRAACRRTALRRDVRRHFLCAVAPALQLCSRRGRSDRLVLVPDVQVKTPRNPSASARSATAALVRACLAKGVSGDIGFSGWEAAAEGDGEGVQRVSSASSIGFCLTRSAAGMAPESIICRNGSRPDGCWPCPSGCPCPLRCSPRRDASPRSPQPRT